MTIPYEITNNSVTVVLKGKPHTIKRGDENYEAARTAVLKENWAAIPRLISKGMAIQDWTGGFFTFKNNFIYFREEQLPPELNNKMLSMVKEKKDPRYLFRFWARLQENPSFRSVGQLYRFLAHEGIPITKDGYFLAYKSVKRDYKDHHSGTCDNTPGNTLTVPRNKVSDDPNTPCHFGLHVGALAYAQSFGGGNIRLVICKVNPRDVVCVPYDSSQHKMRVCKYTVIGNHGDQLPDNIYEEDDDIILGYRLDEDPEGYGDLFQDEKPAEVGTGTDNIQDFAEEDDDEEEDDLVGANDEPAGEKENLTFRIPCPVDKMNRDTARVTASALDIQGRGHMSAAELRDAISAALVNTNTEMVADAAPGWYEADPLEVKEPAPIVEEPTEELQEGRKEILDTLKNKTETPPKPVTTAVVGWEHFDNLTDAQLVDQNLGDLRKYAARVLKVIGASKIPGGKPALLHRIRDIRRK